MPKKSGFTLVELMIVIAIIALLASIIMPKMTGARDRSALNACKANIKQIVIALELYANDNQGKYKSTSYWPIAGGNYLVTGGYLKAAPTCPLGNSYALAASGQTAYQQYPGWDACLAPMVVCWNSPAGGNKPHKGLGTNTPYSWAGGGKVWESSSQ